ncbi:MAG: ABC transporter substrate-binding protein [Janthinobacterium lividum]
MNDKQNPPAGASSTDRRKFIKTTAMAVVASSLPLFNIGRAAADEPLKIGMVLAKQGPFALLGVDLATGVQMAFEQAGKKVLGRPAELIWLDESSPQTASQNIAKLIDEDKVIAVIGGSGSATSLAMGAVALRSRVPFISINAAAREVTGKDCNPFMFRTAATVPVYAHAMAPYLLAMGKRWHFISGAFAFGDDVVKTFSDLLLSNGGTVVGVDRVPVETTDYSSFILKARAANPDVVVSGAVQIAPLLKQFKEFGLAGKLPLAGPAVTDPDLWGAGLGTVSGIYGKSWYHDDPLNSAQEKAFVKTFQDKQGRPPSDKMFDGWHAMRMLLAAIEAAKTSNSVQITHSLEAVRLDDGGGNFTTFRKWDHQQVRRVVVATAKLHPTDKWNLLDVKPSETNAAAIDRMYGTPAEVGCQMAPIGA